MKVSLKWLQKYFADPLPDTSKVCDAFTFHAFEVEERAGDLIDLNVLPDRAGYALSHRGVAKELSAILSIPMKNDPLRDSLGSIDSRSQYLKVEIENEQKCLRYMGALVKGVKVKPSPDWLRGALESVGQRPINNVVDAANYVMLDVGQPLHAFDAGKLARSKDGAYAIRIRDARDGEKITTLAGDEHECPPNTLLIADANADTAIGIAGIKGGKSAEVMTDTVDLIVESANFDGTAIRRAAQALKLPTDASLRFQNRPSPELAEYGMRNVLKLITEIAGGEVAGIVDVYPARPKAAPVETSLNRINSLLGSTFTREEVLDVFNRLGFSVVANKDTFTIIPSFERTDIVIPEDLAEEVGRILGYDRLQATELPFDHSTKRPDQARFRGIEKTKDFLIAHGFTEISTQSFTKDGKIMLANPLDKEKPSLRTNLRENMQEAMERAKYNAPLVLSPSENPKLFEIGTVFAKEGERIEIETSEPIQGLPAISEDEDYEPKQDVLNAFTQYSPYPFVARDIAFWTPSDADDGFTKSIIQGNAGELLVRFDQFDRFEKNGRVSLAYRLVFQSMERTLTDEEVNAIMSKIAKKLVDNGCEVR